MAKQVEGFLVGTYDDITFYKMEGQYYARMKSSLTGKQFWKHKAFEGSRRSCNRFGRGNQLASLVYNEIPESRREYALYCKMKGVAIRMIKERKDEHEVMEALRRMKPVVRRKIVRRKNKISQLANSTIRQWGEGGNLKMRGFDDLKISINRRGRRGRREGVIWRFENLRI